MAIDFATLSIAVKRDDVPKATAELDKLAAAGTRAEQATNRLSGASTNAGVSSVAATRNMGAWAALQAESAGHVGSHSIAIGRLERSLATIVGHFVGAGQAAEILGAGLLKFSIGTLETAGILGGLALLIGLYEKMTEGMREAKKQMDEMTDSLVKQARAAEEATIQGRNNLMLIAQVNQQTVQKESGIGWRSVVGSILTGRPFISGTDAEARSKRLAGVQTGVDQTAANSFEAINKKYEEDRRKEEEAARKSASAAERLAHLGEQIAEYDANLEHNWQAYLQTIRKGRGAPGTPFQSVESMVNATAAGMMPGTVSMPNVSIWDGVTKAQQRHIEKIRQLNEEYAQAKEVFSSTDAAVENFKEGLKGAATGLLQQFSPSNIVNQLTGGLLNSVGNAVTGLIQNAVGGIRHALFGSSGAERNAAREAADSAHAMALQLDAVTRALGHDQLGATIDALKLGLISTLQGINAALPGSKNEAARNAARGLATQQEAEAERQAREQYALGTKYAKEDLEVRNLRALGRGSEGDLLAFKEGQAREMERAIREGTDETFRNNLLMVQQNELLAYLNGQLSNALRNAPSGFYSEAYIGAYATRRAVNSGSAGGATVPGSVTYNIERIVVDGSKSSKEIATAIVNELDRKAASTGGGGTSRATALELLN